MKKKLLVIITDCLSDLIKKGEITERYYNPGNLFDEVHIMMINNDHPDVEKLQITIGSAKLFIHNYPEPDDFFKKTLGWRPWLMQPWVNGAVEIVKTINPGLIRCHGAHLNAFIAAKIKLLLKVPYVISLHINPEEDIRLHPKKEMTDKDLFIYKCQRSFEKIAISQANVVVCVYKWIESYAKQFGAKDIRIIYNVIHASELLEKKNYILDQNRINCVVPGRQFIKKDPSVLLKLLPEFTNIYVTLIGNGSYQSMLKSLAKDLNVENQVIFIDSMPNELLCQELKNYDFLISINDYGGVSKVELEAAFVGMPIITNMLEKEGFPEVLGENVLLYDGTMLGLKKCLIKIITDQKLRETLGINLRNSVKHLRGNIMELNYTKLYIELMEKIYA